MDRNVGQMGELEARVERLESRLTELNEAILRAEGRLNELNAMSNQLPDLDTLQERLGVARRLAQLAPPLIET